MARLQDFQTVTPTSSDKLLVVQSQGQGLVPYGSKLDSANPTGTGSLSLNRKSGTTTGTNSTAIGNNNTASGNYSLASGNGVTASGNVSTANGVGTIAKNRSQNVFGEFNTQDPSTNGVNDRGNYIEIVGKGSSDSNRSNARTLDWSGNEVLAGDCTINGNASLTDHIGSVRTQVIRGNSRWQLARSSEGSITAPLSVLIHGFKCLYIASSVSAGSAISELEAIYINDSGATITLSSGVLQMGNDSNRQFVCIMPNTVKLVQVTT